MSGVEAVGDRVSSNIQIVGVKETIAALRAFEPDLAKAMNKQIRQILTQVRSAAQAKYSAGRWTIRVNQSKILGQISAAGGSVSPAGWGASPGGVRAGIFEFLGTNYSGRRPQVLGAIASLNARYGTPGRFLWSAWDQVGKDVLSQIARVVAAAEQELQARLDAAGEGY